LLLIAFLIFNNIATGQTNVFDPKDYKISKILDSIALKPQHFSKAITYNLNGYNVFINYRTFIDFLPNYINFFDVQAFRDTMSKAVLIHDTISIEKYLQTQSSFGAQVIKFSQNVALAGNLNLTKIGSTKHETALYIRDYKSLYASCETEGQFLFDADNKKILFNNLRKIGQRRFPPKQRK
jgi:hypothetical protein